VVADGDAPKAWLLSKVEPGLAAALHEAQNPKPKPKTPT
jgi:hypothetical protein